MAESIADSPQLSKLWDEAKNGSATSVLARSFRSAWWRCENGHSFQRSPRSMITDSACPECRRGPNTNTIAKKRPSIVPLWNTEKNGELSPTTVDAAHAGNAWWRCPKGHDFQRAPLLMVKDSSCPLCALAERSLAKTNPAVAAEWHPKKNGEISPAQVDADHVMNAWWLCPNGHEYQATVRSRARGSKRCASCYGGWSLENIRSFVKSLLSHVAAFNPSELFALAMQAGVFADKDSRPFVMAISTGRFPREELEKFADGKPSLVDKFAADKALTLEIVDGRGGAKPEAPAGPYALPAAPEPVDAGERVDVDVSREVDATGAASATASVAAADDEMPLVKTQDALAALDSVLIANADAETVKFLLDSAKAKLWRHAYVNPNEAREQAASFNGDVYSTLVRDRFLAEFDEAEALQTPPGYAFRPGPGAPVTPPNLMQRRVAVSIRNERRFGNWSGMGWLSRLETGNVSEIKRPIIKIPLSGEPGEVERRVSRYGDFGKMNNRWYASSSDSTHARLTQNPEEWAHYHTMYQQLRESWPVVPFKEEIRWLSEDEREGLVVGDFGCGEALIAAAVSERHRVYSFDHVAANPSVVACDIARVPLEAKALDVAIFCLSLMGANFTDYIREARRCLRLDGDLHIWEAASYFDDIGKFCAKLSRLGFEVWPHSTEGQFVRIYAQKNAKKPDPTLVLPFRGYGT